jgi:hypothetical protein
MVMRSPGTSNSLMSTRAVAALHATTRSATARAIFSEAMSSACRLTLCPVSKPRGWWTKATTRRSRLRMSGAGMAP